MSPVIPINKQMQEAPSSIPVLGITINENRWLIPMNDIGEILPVPKITPVFLTYPWFLGVINVRGNIYGLSDLGHYLDKQPTRISAKTRIFLLASRLGKGYAILAENILGIRDLTEFTRQTETGHENKSPVITGMYNDRQDRHWRMLSLPTLVQLPSFLQASR